MVWQIFKDLNQYKKGELIMDIYTASEQAYKNGYEDGKKEATKITNELKDIIEYMKPKISFGQIMLDINVEEDKLLSDLISICKGLWRYQQL